MVTVVDAKAFLRDWESGQLLKDRKLELSAEDHRSIVSLLTQQVEFADVIIVNKTDLVSKEDLRKLEGILRYLNTSAKIEYSEKGRVELKKVLDTKLFDFEKAEDAPGWQAVLRGEEISEKDEYGISSFVLEDKRPFHHGRLWEFLNTEHKGLYRAKGIFWIVSQPDFIGELAIAGTERVVDPVGFWLIGSDKKLWPKDPMILREIEDSWHPIWGDRHQRMVFIGLKDVLPDIECELKKCLMTDDELETSLKAIIAIPDPFGNWNERVKKPEAAEAT
jgi:G3E family GTPase